MKKRTRLHRLARVARILYQRESADLARRRSEAREAGEVVAEAEQRMNAPLEAGDFLSQLTLARAARARTRLVEATARVDEQLNTAMDAMTKKKGAESEFDAHAEKGRGLIASQDADEILERIARP